MDDEPRRPQELELALLRRAVNERYAQRERCRRCRRTPLIGERIYVDARGALCCELCRVRVADVGLESRIVHGPEYGHTMRLKGAQLNAGPWNMPARASGLLET